ncbi:MAG: hypothetical protein AUG49_03255 [Catenulispora sp. 13_1_20CM_3_70_7]|nr:MAG: hypothetical protein AUG49_03255 [Catenulispora sp. 13_1_20CM_3_70_7]
MAVGVILEFPGATAQQYDETCALMGLTPRGAGPRGALFHWAAVQDGGMLITDVWRDKERFEEFSREEIGPFSQQAGITQPPKTTFYDIHNTLTAGAITSTGNEVAVVMEFTGDMDQYDEIIELMGFTKGGRGADGCLFHWVAPTPDGARITDVWQDKETFERFSEEQIGPYSAKVGVPPPTSVVFHDVYNFFTAGS